MRYWRIVFTNKEPTKTDLQKYAKDLEAPKTLDGENPTMADLVSAWWDEKVTW